MIQKLLLSLSILICCCASIDTKAQFIENFNDGDFTNNPTWIGNTTDFIVNAATELQSNNTVAGSTFYISTADTFALTAQWELDVRLPFSTSGSNYVDVYLIASASDLSDANTTGYFVRLGNTDDEISLYRKDAGGGVFKIIDGADGVLGSNNSIKLKVTRNSSNVFSLNRDVNSAGLILEGTATDVTYTTSAFFGILIKQSTASFFQKHFFDNISITTYVPDTTPPVVQSVSFVSSTSVDVLFNEPVEATSAQTVTNYSVDNGIGNPVSAVVDAANPALVHLTFGAAFPPNITNTITINNISDVLGNAMTIAGTGTFIFIKDVAPPSIQSAVAIDAFTIDVLFSEPVDAITASQAVNYSVNNGIGNAVSAVRDGANTSLVHLTFGSSFSSGALNTVTVNNVTDTANNPVINGTATFTYTAPYIAQKYDVVINELMPDPDPAQQLPSAEYVEIKNVSGRDIDLQGWRLTSTSTASGAFSSVVLKADSFFIITSTANALSLSQYGRTIGISNFPSLLNTGTQLSLISKEGSIIHSINYTIDWYRDENKNDGGWSLEMIDPLSACAGAGNWKASEDLKGGTPGTVNSVNGNNTDQTGPKLIRASVIDSVTLLLTFDEGLDSAKAASSINYTVTTGSGGTNTITTATPVSPDFNTVQLTLNSPLQLSTIYTITVNNLSDCRGNVISTNNTFVIGLPQNIDSLDIVINEILFNPKKPNDQDYVEIYNRSNKILDLKNLFIATRSSSNEVTNQRQLTVESKFIFPGEYYVISENANIIKQNYTAMNPDNFINIASMPSYPDDDGWVVIVNNLSKVIDEVNYDAKWHFALIDNEEGISLERIDFNGSSNISSNWHSAASTAGFGTPGYKNSQYRPDELIPGEMTAVPKIFSPDNDGFEDYTTINYQLSELGYVANISIFDAAGRPVRILQRNATLGLKGSFRWDGLSDKQTKVQIGTYIVYTEIFNLSGKKKSFKTPVVVASRF